MVNRTHVVIGAIVIIIVLVAAVTLTPKISPGTNLSTNGSDNLSGSSNELQATVTIENGTLNPSNLTVKSGTTVTWIVKDDLNMESGDPGMGKDNSDMGYMITSEESGSVEGKYLFMSDDLASGQNFSYTFDKTGSYGYYDMNHMDNEKMKGTIVVQ